MSIFDSEFQTSGKGGHSIDFMFNAQSYFSNNNSEPNLFNFDVYGSESYSSNLPLGNKNCSIFDGLDGFRKPDLWEQSPSHTPWSNGETIKSSDTTSRIVPYLNSNTPPTPPSSTLENMSVHDFLHNTVEASSFSGPPPQEFLSVPFESLSLNNGIIGDGGGEHLGWNSLNNNFR